jgi:Glutamine amidotransferase domain
MIVPNILGLYARRAPLAPGAVDAAVRELSLNGRRPVRVLGEGRVVLARQEGERSDETIDAPTRRLVVAAGTIDAATPPAAAVLAALDTYGATFASALAGTFAFAVYDPRTEELLVGGDAFGLHPLFVYETDDLFAFATEYEVLAALPGFDRSLDELAWLQYFALGSTQGERTFFAAVTRHPGGAVTAVSPSRRSTRELGMFDVAVAEAAGLDEHADRVYETIRAACVSIARREPELRWALTGGVDTRLIAGTLLRSGIDRARFFTQQRFGGDVLDDCDVLLARLLARHLSVPHDVYTRKRSAPNVMSASFFAERRIGGGARAGGGLVGGELVGGSCVKKLSPLRDARRDLTRALRPHVRARAAEVKRTFADAVGRAGQNGDLLVTFRNLTRAFFTTFYGGSPTDWVMPYRLPLAQVSPFWDARVIREVLAVPFHLIEDYRLYRRIYERQFPDLLALPFETTATGFPRLASKRGEPLLGMQYSPAARELVASADAWAESSYDLDHLRSITDDEDPVLHAFVDFETWRRAFAA